VENSRSAFCFAIDLRFAIETDVRSAAEGEPVIFHDERLDRLTGLSGAVSAASARVLGETRLRLTGDTIPHLSQFLVLVRGRVPVFLEVKSGWPSDPRFLTKVARLVGAYRGRICVMSFDPEVLRFFAHAAPYLPRGLGLSQPKHIGDAGVSPAQTVRLLPSRALSISRADFLAIDKTALHVPSLNALRKATGLPIAVWTVTSPPEARAHLRHAGAIIFEGFHPGHASRM
jgi:glycerophosphoryl diester phosphodiesterase